MTYIRKGKRYRDKENREMIVMLRKQRRRLRHHPTPGYVRRALVGSVGKHYIMTCVDKLKLLSDEPNAPDRHPWWEWPER